MFLDSACALHCMRLFRVSACLFPTWFSPFFPRFRTTEWHETSQVPFQQNTQGFQAFQGQIMASFGLPTMRLKVLLGRGDVIRPIIWVSQGKLPLPNGIPKLTGKPQQKQVIPIFSVLSLSKRCLILSTFLAETFLLGFHHIISYPKNTNSEVKRRDSNEWYILFTVPIRSCCFLWSLLPWFCLKKSSSHLYLYMFQVPGPPPTPPAMVMVITSTPPLWNGWVLGRGGGHPANSNATGRIRWRKLISSKRSMYAEISYMLRSDIES